MIAREGQSFSFLGMNILFSHSQYNHKKHDTLYVCMFCGIPDMYSIRWVKSQIRETNNIHRSAATGEVWQLNTI